MNIYIYLINHIMEVSQEIPESQNTSQYRSRKSDEILSQIRGGERKSSNFLNIGQIPESLLIN